MAGRFKMVVMGEMNERGIARDNIRVAQYGERGARRI
jgi:hypothetical protein